MRIGINASVVSGQMTGVGHFALSLIQALISLESSVEWVILGIAPGLLTITSDNVELVEIDYRTGWDRLTWEQVRLPRLVKEKNLDLLHCPDFSRPLFCSVPVVNTMHDLSFNVDRKYFSIPKWLYKNSMARFAVRRSHWLVTDSEFTRQELLRTYRHLRAPITVIPLGVDPPPARSKPPTLQSDCAPYILFVGTLEARKNLVRLVEAFALLKREMHLPHKLILAGQWGRGAKEIREAISRSGVEADIRTTGYVGRDMIMELYRETDLVVYLSLYEGFGLPVLEAMSHGKPVVCSRSTSVPEVAGDAAEFCDPLSIPEIAAAIQRVITSAGLKAELAEKGVRRATEFTWTSCAKRYLGVFALQCRKSNCVFNREEARSADGR